MTIIDIKPNAISPKENNLAFGGTVKFNFSVFIVSLESLIFYFFSALFVAAVPAGGATFPVPTLSLAAPPSAGAISF
jgi:hypothetical protein